MTRPLSPAAQAVLDGFIDCPIFEDENRIAAALRTVASNSEFADVAAGKTVAVVRVDVLQAIAAELEGSNG